MKDKLVAYQFAAVVSSAGQNPLSTTPRDINESEPATKKRKKDNKYKLSTIERAQNTATDKATYTAALYFPMLQAALSNHTELTADEIAATYKHKCEIDTGKLVGILLSEADREEETFFLHPQQQHTPVLTLTQEASKRQQLEYIRHYQLAEPAQLREIDNALQSGEDNHIKRCYSTLISSFLPVADADADAGILNQQQTDILTAARTLDSPLNLSLPAENTSGAYAQLLTSLSNPQNNAYKSKVINQYLSVQKEKKLLEFCTGRRESEGAPTAQAQAQAQYEENQENKALLKLLVIIDRKIQWTSSSSPITEALDSDHVSTKMGEIESLLPEEVITKRDLNQRRIDEIKKEINRQRAMLVFALKQGINLTAVDTRLSIAANEPDEIQSRIDALDSSTVHDIYSHLMQAQHAELLQDIVNQIYDKADNAEALATQLKQVFSSQINHSLRKDQKKYYARNRFFTAIQELAAPIVRKNKKTLGSLSSAAFSEKDNALLGGLLGPPSSPPSLKSKKRTRGDDLLGIITETEEGTRLQSTAMCGQQIMTVSILKSDAAQKQPSAPRIKYIMAMSMADGFKNLFDYHRNGLDSGNKTSWPPWGRSAPQKVEISVNKDEIDREKKFIAQILSDLTKYSTVQSEPSNPIIITSTFKGDKTKITTTSHKDIKEKLDEFKSDFPELVRCYDTLKNNKFTSINAHLQEFDRTSLQPAQQAQIEQLERAISKEGAENDPETLKLVTEIAAEITIMQQLNAARNVSGQINKVSNWDEIESSLTWAKIFKNLTQAQAESTPEQPVVLSAAQQTPVVTHPSR